MLGFHIKQKSKYIYVCGHNVTKCGKFQEVRIHLPVYVTKMGKQHASNLVTAAKNLQEKGWTITINKVLLFEIMTTISDLPSRWTPRFGTSLGARPNGTERKYF